MVLGETAPVWKMIIAFTVCVDRMMEMRGSDSEIRWTVGQHGESGAGEMTLNDYSCIFDNMSGLHRQGHGVLAKNTASEDCNRLSERYTVHSPDFCRGLEKKVTNKLSTAFQSLILQRCRQTTDYGSIYYSP